MIEDVYPLSPLQEGIYFYWLTNPGSEAYFEQMCYRIHGKLNVAALRESYALLIKRHTVLRTFFTQEVGKTALQVVKKDGDISFEHINLSLQKDISVEDFKAADRKKGFDLHKGSQMRLTVFELEGDEYEFIWSHHHILMDGWCVGILINEFFSIYHSLVQGKPPALNKTYPYSAYIKWLNKLEHTKSIEYWKNYLHGYRRSISIPRTGKESGRSFFCDQTFELSDNERQKLKSFCVREGITENTFLQVLWGILLGKLAAASDVVFGSVVSGRPGDVEGIEDMVGLFINTIPVRIRLEQKSSLRNLLREVQQESILGTAHHYTQLAQIQSEVSSGRSLFDHVLAFENYPVEETVARQMRAGAQSGLTLLSSEAHEYNSYDFTFFVFPGQDFIFKFVYNADVYSAEFVNGLRTALLGLLSLAIARPDILVEEIDSELTRLGVLPAYTSNCSEHQKRLWFIDQFEKGKLYEKSPVYHNLPLAIKLNGTLDTAIINARLKKIIKQNSALRTRISNLNGVPCCRIVDEQVTELRIRTLKEDFSHDGDLLTGCMKLINEPFDVENEALIRFDLITTKNDESILLIVAHHLIADRNTLQLLANIILNSEEKAEEKKAFHYADFTEKQNRLFGDNAPPSPYWQRKLKDAPILYLETDIPREHIHIYDAGFARKSLSPELTKQVLDLCDKLRTTPSDFLLTVFNILLSKYANSNEIVIGALYNNRDNDEHLNIIGPVANLLTLRNRIDGTLSFPDCLELISNDYREAVRHGDTPFEKVVLDVNPGKDMSRTALFDVLFHYEEVEAAARNLNVIELNYGLGKYDLNLLATKGSTIELFLTYNKKYFDPFRMQAFLGHFVNIIERLPASLGYPIAMLDILSIEEKGALLRAADAVDVSYPAGETIVTLFEEQVRARPDSAAVIFGDHALTYRELNEHANQLSNYLAKNFGVHAGDLVAIVTDRSEWMIVALLGVLKAGAAYVPIDPDYPQERIDFIVSDSNCKILLDEAQLALFREKRNEYDSNDYPVISSPGDLAYVIYTSGTTGRPKGVLLEHENVVRLLKTDRPLFDFGPSDIWTMFHSYCFDFSVWEMYGALLFGGKLIVVPKLIAQDPLEFCVLLQKYGVTVLNQTPSAFYNLQDRVLGYSGDLMALRYVIFGGEVLVPARLRLWKEKFPHVKLVNMYGITETTVHVTYKEIGSKEIDESISNIGTPIPTLSCYVLDNARNLLPIGVPGELYVGGKGLARGYLNREELTAERFISNPFRQGERLYRSGDRVKLLPNGDIEYLGRVDDQVKIRGYRIEIGEVQNAFVGYLGIEVALVIARNASTAETELVAYLVTKEQLDIVAVRAYLGERLPSYMIPAHLITIDALPLTANGKVDSKKLPEPNRSSTSAGGDHVPPRDELEKQLVELWEEVLDRKGIGVKDSFFDLGGHSLKAARIIARIHKNFEVRIDYKDLFVEPTIEHLAKCINTEKWLDMDRQPAEKNNSSSVLSI